MLAAESPNQISIHRSTQKPLGNHQTQACAKYVISPAKAVM